MRLRPFVRASLFALVAIPVVIPRPVLAQAAPPAGMAAVETARSRDCVGKMAELAAWNAKAAPYAERVQRIQALANAVAVEDSARVAPFDTTDALERAVRDWFVEDHRLGLEIAGGDSAKVAARDAARDAIASRLQEEATSITTEARSSLQDAPAARAAAQPCENAIFVRPVVLEECKTTASPLCDAAALPADSAIKVSPYRFVDAPDDLWDVEQLRPWTDPGPLQVAPDGSLAGARTVARTAHGNIIVAVALAPLIQPRAQLDSARVAAFDTNLDSLGFNFDHPAFVMAPALEIQAAVPAPIGGETHYLLHFGDVSDPDVVWSGPVDSTTVIQATVPANSALLDRLRAGDELTFTAVSVPEGSTEGTPVYTLSLMNVNEAQASTALLNYMASGGLSDDLKKIAPPGGATGG